MTRKNPDNRPLRIVSVTGEPIETDASYPLVLAQLAVAQAYLVRSGKKSAMPYFIAITKEIERLYGFKFEVVSRGDNRKRK